MEINPATLSILVGTVLPLLVGIVTKQVTDRRIKASLLALLSGLTGLASTAINEGGLLTQEAFITAAIAWVTAVATYYGFLKPTGISPTVNDKTANVGI